MRRPALTYLATALAFCACDFIWLGFIANDFYRRQLGELLLAQPNWVGAILFYVLYIAGIVLFVVARAAPSGSLVRAAWLGALFGLVAYGTYDLTNLATLKGFTVQVVAADLAWGAFVTAVGAVAGTLVAR